MPENSAAIDRSPFTEEPAPPRRRFLTYENGLLVMLGVTFGVVFIDRNALTTLMPFIRGEFGLSNTQVGVLAAGLSVTWAISGYVVGLLSDRMGRRKPFLVAAVLLFSATTLLLAARLVMGVAEGPVLPLSQTLLALASSEHRRGLNAGLMQATLTSLIGHIAAPVLLVAVAAEHGWRMAFFVAAIPGLIMALVMLRYVREPVIAKPERQRDTVSQWALIRVRNIALCMLISVCLVSWMVIAWAFLPLYFTEVRHFSPETMGVLMGSLGLSSAASGLLLPALSDRIGRKPVILFFTAIAVVTPLGVVYGPPSALAIGILMLIGWTASGTFSIFMATVPAESVPATAFGAAIGLVGGMGELIGGFGGPPLAGMLADRYGLEAPFALMAALAVIATLLAAGLIETHSPKAARP